MINLSRREFLGYTVAAATLGLSGVVPSTAGATEPYGDLRMGIQSYSLRHFSFAEAVTRTEQLGLHHVELYPGHVDHAKVSAQELSDAKNMMADHGIVADAYGVTGFTTDETAGRKVFEFAKALGLRSISADPKPDSFDVLDGLVEEYGIPIAIHNHGPHHHWGKPETILEAVKDHHQLIGVCADTGHFLRAEVDPVEAIQMLRGRVYGLHLKDFVDEDTEVIAGEGKLDLAALFQELHEQQFDGACSIEFELNPEDPMAGIQAGLSNMLKATVR